MSAQNLIAIFLVIFSTTSFIILYKTGAWWIRVWDFPRIQILAINLTLVLFMMVTGDFSTHHYIALVFGLVSMILDVYRIVRYLPLRFLQEVKQADKNEISLSILSSNVRQKNTSYHKIISLVKERNPDIFIAIETDDKWAEALSSLKEYYNYSKFHPLDNTYGFVILSIYPFDNLKIRNLVDDNVPSLSASIIVQNQVIHFYVLHPRPPRPKEGPSDERDGELLQVAKEIRNKRDTFLVVGDFNDVAWSHTTRVFLRVSGLLDPRRGRGLFSTFPSFVPLLRFPLDHIFVSNNWQVQELERLREVGSDHFPIWGSFFLVKPHRDKLGDNIDDQLRSDIKDIEKRSENWSGPNEEV